MELSWSGCVGAAMNSLRLSSATDVRHCDEAECRHVRHPLRPGFAVLPRSYLVLVVSPLRKLGSTTLCQPGDSMGQIGGWCGERS